MLNDFVEARGGRVANYYREHIGATKLERPELSRLLSDSQQGDILLVEQIDRLTRLNNTDWLKLKKQIGQHELRIVSLYIPISWQALNHQDPTQNDPITQAVLSAINTMLIDLMAAMSHKDWISHRERQKQGIKRAQNLGEYKGKQADKERHEKVIYYRKYKRLSIPYLGSNAGWCPVLNNAMPGGCSQSGYTNYNYNFVATLKKSQEKLSLQVK